MVTLQLKIKTCIECPHCKITRLYTEDSWESANDYWCKATPDVPKNERGRSALPFKLIKGYVEWHDEIPTPPEWCPFAEPDYKKTKRIEAIRQEILGLDKKVNQIADLGGVPGAELKQKIVELTLELTALEACPFCGYNPCLCDQQ
jgi:hypothetical protein